MCNPSCDNKVGHDEHMYRSLVITIYYRTQNSQASQNSGDFLSMPQMDKKV